MPHAGLMDENELGSEMGLLMRARLHIRGGKRRLRQGKISAGIVTLYDALLAAMDWYIASPSRRRLLQIKDEDNLKDEKIVYDILVRSGILDGKFDFIAFDKLIDIAIRDDMAEYDYTEILQGIESVMAQLGVMPFDENLLPKEDPKTF